MTTPTTAELTLSRTFDAPRDLVFQAWTDAAHLAQWWNPSGGTLEVAELDVRPGGRFHYCQRGADGQGLWGLFVYREVTPPERLVYVSAFSDAQGNVVRAPFSPTWPLELLNTLTLKEDGQRTHLTLTGGPLNATAEETQTYTGALEGMQQGFAGVFDRLDALLKQG